MNNIFNTSHFGMIHDCFLFVISHFGLILVLNCFLFVISLYYIFQKFNLSLIILLDYGSFHSSNAKTLINCSRIFIIDLIQCCLSQVDEGMEVMLCCWLQQLQEFGGPEVDKPDLLQGSGAASSMRTPARTSSSPNLTRQFIVDPRVRYNVSFFKNIIKRRNNLHASISLLKISSFSFFWKCSKSTWF